MTKNRTNNQVGDFQTPPLVPPAQGLRTAADAVAQVSIDTPPKATNARIDAHLAMYLQSVPNPRFAAISCTQTIWLSYFFDGTGNNMDADVGTLKHSNVARLYRAHMNDSKKSVHRIYIPGLGTYFQNIGDAGGSDLGLGAGYMGQERLAWAIDQFDEKLKGPLGLAKNPSNRIVEINVAVFGFSRGAALARAFVNLLLGKRCRLDTKGWRHEASGAPLRVRFMGLFDTVASVGIPMSSNTTSKIGAARKSISHLLDSRLRDTDFAMTVPIRLAFRREKVDPADPAPGLANGHNDWGAAMQIPEMVEEVRHFIAAHEIRNSFPVESVSTYRNETITKPAHFFETVYPGVHSDVGGSYRPGEGGRSEEASENLGLIPLRHMYEYAIAKGIPFFTESAWTLFNHSDFKVSSTLIDRYNHYLREVSSSASLGTVLSQHMRLYFSWRFHVIRRMSGRSTEAIQIAENVRKYREEESVLTAEIEKLNRKNDEILKKGEFLRSRRASYVNNSFGASNVSDTLRRCDKEIADTNTDQREILDDLFKAKARRDALPTMDSLKSMLELYDRQLLADVRAIHEVYSKGGSMATPHLAKRQHLRPHYKALIDSYENEYLINNGLRDQKIIDFFDKHVHDSLAGFAKDATLPSDPRVVYLGGNTKYAYASSDPAASVDRQHKNALSG